jgi:ribosomal protein L29
MLTFSEVRQLSDRDLSDELKTSRDSLFRQKMGVKTGHLKDNHMVAILKKYVAQLMTENTRRSAKGEKVAKTADAITKKVAESKAEVAKAQEGEKKKVKKVKAEGEEAEATTAEKDTADVKVKKVAKKGLFKSKDEK